MICTAHLVLLPAPLAVVDVEGKISEFPRNLKIVFISEERAVKKIKSLIN